MVSLAADQSGLGAAEVPAAGEDGMSAGWLEHLGEHEFSIAESDDIPVF